MEEPKNDTIEDEHRALIAEARMDAILAGLPVGDHSIEAGGITLAFADPEDEDSDIAEV